jgi:hypothetical protein
MRLKPDFYTLVGGILASVQRTLTVYQKVMAMGKKGTLPLAEVFGRFRPLLVPAPFTLTL